ncbi:MAG: hypothetical protein U0271_05340 [Polyangiaceae bacterium]
MAPPETPETPKRPALTVRGQKRSLGTADPIVFERAAPDGYWVVACQARNDTNGDGKVEVLFGQHGEAYGDELRPYLLTDAGPGRALEAFVDSDRTGRYIAHLAGGHLMLLDTIGSSEVDLTKTSDAAGGNDSFPLGPHAAGAFGAGGQLLFVRGQKDARRLAVRTLATGDTVEVDVGSGVLWRASPTSSPAWAYITVMVGDTDKNGKIEPPTIQTDIGARACRGPVGSYSTGGRSGDETETRLVALDGKSPPRPGKDPNRIGILGDELVIRESDGSISLEDTSGKKTTLVSAACGGWVRGFYAPKNAVLVACDSLPGTPAHWIQKGGDGMGKKVADTGWSRYEGKRDYWGTGSQRLNGLNDGDDGWIQVDLSTAKPFHNTSSDDWFADFAEYEGVVLGGDYGRSAPYDAPVPVTLFDLDRGTSKGLGFNLPAKGRRVTRDQWLVAEEVDHKGPWVVIDVRDGTVKGRVADSVLAVSSHGEVLTSHNGRGPAVWQWPE